LDLQQRGRIPESLVENLERLFLGLSRGARQRVVDDLFGRRALAAAHDDVHELGDRFRLVYRVGRDDTLDRTVAARHQAAALPFSRLAPYLLRAFLRFLVPAVSLVPPYGQGGPTAGWLANVSPYSGLIPRGNSRLGDKR